MWPKIAHTVQDNLNIQNWSKKTDSQHRPQNSISNFFFCLAHCMIFLETAAVGLLLLCLLFILFCQLSKRDRPPSHINMFCPKIPLSLFIGYPLMLLRLCPVSILVFIFSLRAGVFPLKGILESLFSG